MAIYSTQHKSFGKRIKDVRNTRGLTQEALADRVGVDRSYIGYLERGERNPSLGMVFRIAKALKASTSELLKDV